MVMQSPQRTGAIPLTKPEYDINACEHLTSELEAIGSECTAIDFSNVQYIDSSCLTVLIRAGTRLKASNPGLKLTLLNLRPQVSRIFEITQLGKYFDLR